MGVELELAEGEMEGVEEREAVGFLAVGERVAEEVVEEEGFRGVREVVNVPRAREGEVEGEREGEAVEEEDAVTETLPERVGELVEEGV